VQELEMPRENHGRPRRDVAAEIANTFEWLITAFVLAFVFRAFVMEAFRIPTGSMADTLKGAHFRLRCRQCGYRYDYGFIPQEYGLAQDTIPRGRVMVPRTRCPSCGYYRQASRGTVANGDRILVLKCIYQFLEPRRWDVIVFKNPLEPRINYIKRLAGRPGETIEIIDGDIYVNGQISRKPPRVQEDLWLPVYDNDYRPVRPKAGTFNGHPWRPPLRPAEGSAWREDAEDPARFGLADRSGRTHQIVFDPAGDLDLRASGAYNDLRAWDGLAYCSDLMVRLYATCGPGGRVGVILGKYETTYTAWADVSGVMAIESTSGGETAELVRKTIRPPEPGQTLLVKFVNADHRLVFEFGRDKLCFSLGSGPDGAGRRRPDMKPRVKVFGSGELDISHVAIFKDIHYTSTRIGSEDAGRATEGNALTLAGDQFFVLGDNSPSSQDGRWWESGGVGNNGRLYRPGIVPREYLVGKALFVYWPSWFRPSEMPWLFVPNIGQMRFIHGGGRW
jgi:signal peptidase I